MGAGRVNKRERLSVHWAHVRSPSADKSLFSGLVKKNLKSVKMKKNLKAEVLKNNREKIAVYRRFKRISDRYGTLISYRQAARLVGVTHGAIVYQVNAGRIRRVAALGSQWLSLNDVMCYLMNRELDLENRKNSFRAKFERDLKA